MLDLYCFGGGFGIQAALGGADEVLAIDRSEPALALAVASAKLNGVDGAAGLQRGEVFAELERLHGQGERFDLVIADPPAFAQSKKESGAGAARLSQAGAARGRAGR